MNGIYKMSLFPSGSLELLEPVRQQDQSKDETPLPTPRPAFAVWDHTGVVVALGILLCLLLYCFAFTVLATA
jgi:hypothetical protein